MNNKALLAVWLFILFLSPLLLFSQSTVKTVSLQSPDQKINVALSCQQKRDAGEWYIKERSSSIEVKMLRRGGFVASLIPLQ